MTERLPQTFGELDVAIVGGEMRLAAYLMELEELEADGQDATRARELVRGVEAQLALLRERRERLRVSGPQRS
jgi:hypothetical protein